MSDEYDLILGLSSNIEVSTVLDGTSSNESFSDDDVFPEDCTVDVEYVDGMKEGPATVRTSKGIIYARLNYQEGKLNGLCTFNDLYGKKRFEGYYENGVKDGWGCEYDSDRQIVFYGFYRNGERHSELTEVEGMEDYYCEILDEQIISICQYDEQYQKDGLCFIYENGEVNRLSLFEHGLEMMVLKDFEDDHMIEYQNNESIYEGEYSDDVINFCPREGQGEEYQDGSIVYNGEWKNNKRNGTGDSYKDGYIWYSGLWINGLPNGEGELLDENGDSLYKGCWKNGLLTVDEKTVIDYTTGKPLPPPKQKKEQKPKEVVVTKEDLNKPDNQDSGRIQRCRSNAPDSADHLASDLFSSFLSTLIEMSDKNKKSHKHETPAPTRRPKFVKKPVHKPRPAKTDNQETRQQHVKKTPHRMSKERQEQLMQNRRKIEERKNNQKTYYSNQKRDNSYKSEQKRDNSHKPEQKKDNYHKPEQKRDNSHKPEQKRDNSHKPDQRKDHSHKPDQRREYSKTVAR